MPLDPPDHEINISKGAALRIFKNAGTLLTGKAFGGVLSLGTLAIAARTLGPEGLGFLVLAHAYVVLIARIARFQSWQAIIRFGGPLIATDNTNAFKTLIRYTVKLDLISAALAVTLSLSLLEPAAKLFDWPDEARSLIAFYCLAGPMIIAATPTGILRLFDQFKTLGLQLTLTPWVRFIGALIVWAIGGGLTGFLIVWISGAVLNGASLWFLGWRALKSRDLVPPLKPKAAATAPKEWLPFVLKTNLTSTVDQLQAQMPLLIVGAVLGSAASGFLQLATNLSNLIAHPTNMLNQATYPELSRIYNAHGRAKMRAVAIKSLRMALAIATPLVIVYLLFGKTLAVTCLLYTSPSPRDS